MQYANNISSIICIAYWKKVNISLNIYDVYVLNLTTYPP